METFVVRVWTPAADGEARAELRRLHGMVEHVATGRTSAFRSLDELSALVLSSLDVARESIDLRALNDLDSDRVEG